MIRKALTSRPIIFCATLALLVAPVWAGEPIPQLAGHWTLNEELSEDAREKMREKMSSRRGGAGGGGFRAGAGNRGGGGAGGPGGWGGGRGAGTDSTRQPAQELTIELGANEVSITSEDRSTRRFDLASDDWQTTPRGVEIRATWKKTALEVETRGEDSRTRTEKYAIDEDGRLLVATTISTERLGKLSVQRVYDRVVEADG